MRTVRLILTASVAVALSITTSACAAMEEAQTKAECVQIAGNLTQAGEALTAVATSGDIQETVRKLQGLSSDLRTQAGEVNDPELKEGLNGLADAADQVAEDVRTGRTPQTDGFNQSLESLQQTCL